MLVNSSPTNIALHVTTPVKLASAFVLLLYLNRVEPAPAAQNPTAPMTRRGLVAHPSRGAQRARVGVWDTIIRGLLQEHEVIT